LRRLKSSLNAGEKSRIWTLSVVIAASIVVLLHFGEDKSVVPKLN
jgi:hypothetical protein